MPFCQCHDHCHPVHEGHADGAIIPLRVWERLDDIPLRLYNPKNGQYEESSLHSCINRQTVVVFYEADFADHCAQDLEQLAAKASDRDAQKTDVIVVSTDSVLSHKKRCETDSRLKSWGMLMVADKTAELSRMLGVYDVHTGDCLSAVALLDADHHLVSLDILPFRMSLSVEEILRRVAQLTARSSS